MEKIEKRGVFSGVRVTVTLALLAAATLALMFGVLSATASRASAEPGAEGSDAISVATVEETGASKAVSKRGCAADVCAKEVTLTIFPDPGCQFSVEVAWGDGTSDNVVAGPGEEEVDVSHEYKKRKKARVYTVTTSGVDISGNGCVYEGSTYTVKVPRKR